MTPGSSAPVSTNPGKITGTRRLLLSLNSKSAGRAALLGFAVAYAAYFFMMVSPGLNSWFSEDDLLSLFYCWSKPLGDLLKALVFFWQPYTRPLRELVFYILYSAWGFDPFPSNVLRTVLCALNVAVLGLFVRRLARSWEAGVLAIVLAGFHPWLFSLYFDSGMLSDVLTFFFYYAAFTLYIGYRSKDRLPGAAQMVAILVLFVAALDSKEIAVSFPVALLLYELIFFPLAKSGRDWARRLLLPLLAGLITLIFIIGKSTGPEALNTIPTYTPQPSLGMYLNTYSAYAAEFALVTPQTMKAALPFVLAGCIILALVLRNRVLIWASLFNLVAILPIAFIPPRNGFAFVVPLVGWAVYGAELLVHLRKLVTRDNELLRAPSRLAVFALLCMLTIPPEVKFMNDVLMPNAQQEGFHNRRVYAQLRRLLPDQLGNRKVLALHDPFKLGYLLLFMVQLGWEDPTITVETNRTLAARNLPVNPASYDFVLDYEARFTRVR
jgi:hypothetical protein